MKYYAYCNAQGELFKSKKIGKVTLHEKKPKPYNLAIMKYYSDGFVTQICEVTVNVKGKQ